MAQKSNWSNRRSAKGACFAHFPLNSDIPPLFASWEICAIFSCFSSQSNGTPLPVAQRVPRLLHTKTELLLIAQGVLVPGPVEPLPSVSPNHGFLLFPPSHSFLLFCPVSFSRTSCQTSYHSQAEYSRSLLYANYLLTVALYIHSVTIGLPNLRHHCILLRLRLY